MSAKNAPLDRKSLKRPDQFVIAVQEFFSKSLKEQSRIWIAALILLIVSGGVFLGLSHYYGELEVEGRNELFKAVSILEKEQEKAEKEKTKGKTSEIYAESLKALTAVSEKFKGTRVRHDAQYLVARLYFDQGEPAEAVTWYEKAVESAPSSLERGMALYGLIFAQESASQCDQAIQTVDQKLNKVQKPLQGDVLLVQGRCYQTLKQTEKARKVYEKILAEHPNTSPARSAEALLSRPL